MANKILTGVGWENRIRYVLGVDEAYLSNDVLHSPDIIDMAEINIIGIIPNYGSIQGKNKVRLENATVLECAILVCKGMPARLPIKETGPHRSHELDVDWEELQVKLEEEQEGVLSDILEEEFGIVLGLRGTAFTVTKPCREWEK